MAHRTHKTRITKIVLCGTGVQSVGVVMKNERRCAQRHSKVSEWLSKMAHKTYRTHRTHRPHKTKITKNVLCRTGVQSVGVVIKNESRCAQRHSKVSESDGCPSGYAGRMGETVSAQRHSKVSEWLSKMSLCRRQYGGRVFPDYLFQENYYNRFCKIAISVYFFILIILL